MHQCKVNIFGQTFPLYYCVCFPHGHVRDNREKGKNSTKKCGDHFALPFWISGALQYKAACKKAYNIIKAEPS